MHLFLLLCIFVSTTPIKAQLDVPISMESEKNPFEELKALQFETTQFYAEVSAHLKVLQDLISKMESCSEGKRSYLTF